jgi:hypothetical protein
VPPLSASWPSSASWSPPAWSSQQEGTGSVDGVAVTNYSVAIDLSSELDQPGLSDEQRAR